MLPLPKPAVRPLAIFPTDPTRGYAAARTTTILVENEPVTPGPVGDRLEVVDYDGVGKVFYDPIDLDDPAVLMQGGLAPTESDPRFHQQMVYAVASRTLANFDRALGRRVDMRKGSHKSRLRLLPHAFQGQNAFFDPGLHAILFGYFTADPFQPGPNIPGQTIFTCLSHDIIAHEMTHAIVHRLRRHFLEPSNLDTLAFHEGFADIVALLQHFSFRYLLADEIKRSRGGLRNGGVLLELAQQFGLATGTGQALRSAIDEPDPRRYATVQEPHERGLILLAAVFDGFLTTYQSRIQDLIRIATGGSGLLPRGELQADLANRIATEAARTAQRQLDMCIRAFDYLPPVDITFGDYLRALVTADFELSPDDEWGQRAALIEGFRKRGVYPDGVVSLAEESLRWTSAGPETPRLHGRLAALLPDLLQREAQRLSKFSADPAVRDREVRAARPQGDGGDDDDASTDDIYSRVRAALTPFINKPENAVALRLNPRVKTVITAVNAVFRTAPNGALLIEMVVQLVQTDPQSVDDETLGGVPLRGGSTLIIGVDGVVRYVISKPLPGEHLDAPVDDRARARVDRQRGFVAGLDDLDVQLPYRRSHAARMKARACLRAVHQGG